MKGENIDGSSTNSFAMQVVLLQKHLAAMMETTSRLADQIKEKKAEPRKERREQPKETKMGDKTEYLQRQNSAEMDEDEENQPTSTFQEVPEIKIQAGNEASPKQKESKKWKEDNEIVTSTSSSNKNNGEAGRTETKADQFSKTTNQQKTPQEETVKKISSEQQGNLPEPEGSHDGHSRVREEPAQMKVNSVCIDGRLKTVAEPKTKTLICTDGKLETKTNTPVCIDGRQETKRKTSVCTDGRREEKKNKDVHSSGSAQGSSQVFAMMVEHPKTKQNKAQVCIDGGLEKKKKTSVCSEGRLKKKIQKGATPVCTDGGLKRSFQNQQSFLVCTDGELWKKGVVYFRRRSIKDDPGIVAQSTKRKSTSST